MVAGAVAVKEPAGSVGVFERTVVPCFSEPEVGDFVVVHESWKDAPGVADAGAVRGHEGASVVNAARKFSTTHPSAPVSKFTYHQKYPFPYMPFENEDGAAAAPTLPFACAPRSTPDVEGVARTLTTAVVFTRSPAVYWDELIVYANDAITEEPVA